ncbi:MAG: PEGA domain-containing protein [Polyangiaceae bacterium]|nr:PEGA domain-containing protein [Polyangiaceae bacterium]
MFFTLGRGARCGLRRLRSHLAKNALIAAFLITSTVQAQPQPADPQAPAAPADKQADRADELFSQGNEAFDKGEFERAYTLYQQAWALKRTYDIAGNLGQVELKLGKYRDAAQHLDFTLRLFPPTGKSAPREAIRRAFDEARREVGTLSIVVNVQGAEVKVDGASVGRSPFESKVFVEPGSRTIEASLQAHIPTRITIDIAKNEQRDVTLSLLPKAQPPPLPRNVPLLITGFGLSLAAAVTGVGLMIASADRGTDADILLRELVNKEADGKCPCGSEEERARLKGLRGDHDLFFNVSVGMFSAAGVLAVGTAVYALTPAFLKPQSKTARVLPLITHNSAGAAIIGTF